MTIPRLIARRSWWSIPVLVWGLGVGASLLSHFSDVETQTMNIAVEGARNMFRMVVLTRAWNAEHGGVYLPVGEKIKPNPYLEHPRRDLVTTDGTRLTLVNPAFMTRLISELANDREGATFHITSLKPIRPGNEADAWEKTALGEFEKGVREVYSVVPMPKGQESALRYMAPLKVTPPCLACHAKQGYRDGDVRGGISITLPYSPVASAQDDARKQSTINHLAIFSLGSLLGIGLLELLRRRWMSLGETIDALEHAKNDLAASNEAEISARNAAEAANLAKSRFLANLSHELRTPLNAISGFSHLLKRKLDDPKQLESVEHIQQASGHLLEMINQLLCLAKADTGELEAQSEDFQVGQLADQLFKELLHKVAGRPLAAALEIEPATMACRLHGDRGHIAEIARHYLANAVKFSQSGEITLAVSLQPQGNGLSRLRVAVRDQGIGIAPENLSHLFMLFHQVDASSTRHHGGNGIGLILCKRLADLMGGEVGVTSELGRGSEFWLEVALPSA